MVSTGALGVIIFISVFGGLIFLTLGALVTIVNKFPIKKGLHKIAWLASISLVVLSPFIVPSQVSIQNKLATLEFGLPFRFITQYVRGGNIGDYHTFINHWGHSITSNISFNLYSFLGSIIWVYIVVHVVIYMLNKRTSKSLSSVGTQASEGCSTNENND